MPSERALELGRRLRQVRDVRDWSLRDVAGRADINHGYLSQLERGEIEEPGPTMLHKVASGYDLPFSLVMEWSGYIEPTGRELTPNQAIALSYLGENPSQAELEAVRAVLDAIRSRGATFSGEAVSLDVHLDAAGRQAIRAQVLALLRKADVLGTIPTPLDQVMEIAGLVAAGEIVLTEQERRDLRARIGSIVDTVLSRLKGAIHLRTSEIWVQPDLYMLKKRFVVSHEIGHDILPAHRELAYLDDATRLRPDVRLRYEREANHAAIEILAQGDALRREADDSALDVTRLSELSAKYQISMQAVSRYVVEETRRPAALAIHFRGASGNVGPVHIYCSDSFETQFEWSALRLLPREVRIAADDARQSGETRTVQVPDLSGALVELAVEAIDTPYALIAIFLPIPKKLSLRRLFLRKSGVHEEPLASTRDSQGT